MAARIITYKAVNAELGTSYSPNNYCSSKKKAIEGDGDDIYGAGFANNRLITKVLKTIPAYTITFNKRVDGVDSLITTKAVNAGDTIGTVELPQVDRHLFDHWEPSDPTTVLATGNATYTAVYKKICHIIFLDEDGNFIIDYDLLEGSTMPNPGVPEKPGYTDGRWTPELPATVIDDATYRRVYVPDRDYYAYPMDNMYQIYNSSKALPQTSIKKWAPAEGHWWSGPIDGDGDDSIYGADNGISATVVANRHTRELNGKTYFTFEAASDSCVYEYAEEPDPQQYPGTWPSTGEMLTDWQCPCYDGSGNLMGYYRIHSDCDWIKFCIRSTASGYTLDDIHPPFSVDYWIAENTSTLSRKGIVTTTTPGGTSNYNSGKSQKNKPYITEAPTFFYLKGVNEP